MTLELARQLDASDPLRGTRERFTLPDGIIYLDGNSLGALPKATPAHLADVIERQWGKDLITSWNKNGWIEWPRRIAAKLAPILGAKPHELLIADSTTICLFKLLGAAVAAQPGRSVLLTEEGNFPTDVYAAEGLLKLFPGLELKTVPLDDLAGAVNDQTAALFLTHVNYRSGVRHDMRALNAAAHAAGSMALWDLSHSAGAMQLDLNDSDCDLAVGCGYKYLNGGPGAPAFLYVAEHLQERLQSPLPGWMGHADPFTFGPTYSPAPGIDRFLTGTPSILGLAALEAGIDTFKDAHIADIELKAEALTSFFIEAVEQLCGEELALSVPRETAARGSHVCFSHPEGYAVMQALIARGIVGDFRPPNLLRFGFAPLYNSFEETWLAAEALAEILGSRHWDRAEYLRKQKVT